VSNCCLRQRVRWEPAGLRLALQRAKDDNDPYDVVIIMAGTNNLTTMPTSNNVANLVKLHTCAADFGAKVISVAVPRHRELLSEPDRSMLDFSASLATRRAVSTVTSLASPPSAAAPQHHRVTCAQRHH